MTPNQLPPLSDEQLDSIFAGWLDAACLIHQEGSDTIEPAPQTHLHKNDVVQLMLVVESATLAALAQQAQEPVAWLYVDTVGERYLCFSRPTGGGAITNLYATPPAPQPAPVDDVLTWAVSRWEAEVKNRPLINKNRRPLDDAWRQVVRFAGGDPEKLLGPSHDELLGQSPAPQTKVQP